MCHPRRRAPLRSKEKRLSRELRKFRNRKCLVKKIDVFPHIFPQPLLDRAAKVAVEPALGQFKRNSGIPVLYDLDARFRAMDQFGDDYMQILTISNPPIE